MGPIHIILIVVVTIIFLIVLYKIWYQPGDTSLTVPDDLAKTLSNVKTNVTSTGPMCDVTGVLSIVDMNGSHIENKTVTCSNCTGYLSLQPAGSCKYVDYNKKAGTCETVGEAIPCPFDE